MAAPEGNKFAEGNSGGKAMNNRKMAAEVRELGLAHIKRILTKPIVEMDKGEYDIFNQTLLRIAPSLLPRLTEVTGEDGGAIIIDNATQNAVNDALMKFVAPKTSPAPTTTPPNGNSGANTTPLVKPAAASAAPVSVQGK